LFKLFNRPGILPRPNLKKMKNKDLDSKEFYRIIFNEIVKICGSTFTTPPSNFPIKRAAFYYIKKFVEGSESQDKLLKPKRLEKLLKYLKLGKVNKKVFYSFH